jgi:glycerophosphoryl diester phosphodiesterase
MNRTWTMQNPFELLRTSFRKNPQVFLGKGWETERALPWNMPKWQVHRGYHLEGLQENTLEALIAAKNIKAEMVEFDVRLAQDKTPVLVHDEDLKRIIGDTEKVANLLPSELKKRASIPSLQEVLVCDKAPAFLNIEIKSSSVAGDGIEHQIALVLKRFGFKKKCLISSFNPFSLARMAWYLPNIPRALLVCQDEAEKNNLFLKEMMFARLARPSVLNCDEKMLTPEFILLAKNLSIPLAAWTVNDYARAEELLSLGVQSIISDLPPPAYF